VIGTRTEAVDPKSTPFQPYSEVFGLQRFRECELIHDFFWVSELCIELHLLQMASLSTTSLSFKAPSTTISQVLRKASSSQSVTFGRFTSSTKSLRLQISCAAKAETVQKVSDIVKEQLALAADVPLTAESKFSALGADSLDTVEIVMALEEKFNISVEESDAQNITTIQEAADLIEDLVQKKPAAETS
jgi:acyl carrier protein